MRIALLQENSEEKIDSSFDILVSCVFIKNYTILVEWVLTNVNLKHSHIFRRPIPHVGWFLIHTPVLLQPEECALRCHWSPLNFSQRGLMSLSTRVKDFSLLLYTFICCGYFLPTNECYSFLFSVLLFYT